MAEVERYPDKASFMDALGGIRPDLFLPEMWTDTQREQALETVKPRETRRMMFTSIPMRCKASECVFRDTCPLYEQNLAPRGLPCPLEMAVVTQFMQEYMEELGVDPTNLVEVSMIRDLVDQEVQYMRKTKVLAQDHFIQENVCGVDPEGHPVMRKELHLAVELEDKLHKRKRDLRNQLLATREARARVGQAPLETAQAIANIMDNVREFQAAKDQALKARLGEAYRDEYVEDVEVIPSEG
jgi:hypothetical protein